MNLASTGGTNLLTLLGIGANVLTAVSQIRQGQIERDTFEFNAAIKQQEAQAIRARQKLNLEVQRKKARRSIAEAQAAFVGGGVRSLVGSPAVALSEVAEALELDILIGQYNADIDEIRAINEAQFQLVRAQQAGTTGFLKAGQTLLATLPDIRKIKFKPKAPREPKTRIGNLRSQLEVEGALEFFG